MKHSKLVLLIFIIVFFFGSPHFAQLLNGSFEHWDVLGNPVSWYTTNTPSLENAVVQSSDAQDGISSVKIEVMNYLGMPYSGNLQSLDTIYSTGHPITERYTNLSGYHKFSPIGSVHLLIIVTVYDEAFMPIGVGGIDEFNPVSNWSQFNIPIEYFINNDAASIIFSVSIVDTATSGFDINTVGSTALIDNLSLGNPTNISENSNIIRDFSLSQNYPNPFNPSTIINYSIPNVTSNFGLSNVTLNIYDILGSEIATLVNKQQKSGFYEVEWNATDQPSGIYFYKLVTGNYIGIKKMILLK